MESEMPFDDFGDARQIAAERALGEFRAARPVALRDRELLALAFPVEGLTERQIRFLRGARRDPRLVIPGGKVRLAANWEGAAAALRLEPLTRETIEEHAGHVRAGAVNGAASHKVDVSAPSEVEAAALALANLSLLLPAVMVAHANEDDLRLLPVISAGARDILAYRDREAGTLRIVTRTFVPLDEAGRCEFVVFRGGDGFRDQIAVIVGDPAPNGAVLARIHSACLTGDLFASLKCDCGDQLRGTVKAMSEQGGGVLLYLDQEGRGNGIANKLRAYALQEEGFDTYVADEMLGFGQDQRRFDFAAGMLKQLGFTSVRLMTNNPQKVAALQAAGLDVVSTHRVLTRTTAHNANYLAAKRDKAGHLIGGAALDGIDLEEVLRPAATQT
jgi:GTP cyclohydrolase II